MEVVKSCFGSRKVLEFSFEKYRGCAMLVNCFSAGKIRESHYHHCGGCTGIFHNQECLKVQFPHM